MHRLFRFQYVNSVLHSLTRTVGDKNSNNVFLATLSGKMQALCIWFSQFETKSSPIR